MPSTTVKSLRNPRRVTTPVDHVLAALTSLEAPKAKAAPRAKVALDRVNSQTLTVLEAVWAAVRNRHQDLPAVAFTIGGSETTRGHFHAETWADSLESGYTRHEVFIAGERLKDGPREVLATLLHEAAHALAHVRKIQDTSRGGRFHNTRFRALAVELGLDVEKVGAIGWSGTTLTETTAAQYRVSLEKLATIGGHRRQLTRGQATGRKSNNNGRVLTCPTCDRKCRMSIGAAEVGPVVCWPCYVDSDEDLSAALMAAADEDEDN